MNDESRPKAAHGTPAKKSEHIVASAADRRRERRQRHFPPEVVAYLEQLDRRREAEWRLHPIGDFIDTAA